MISSRSFRGIARVALLPVHGLVRHRRANEISLVDFSYMYLRKIVYIPRVFADPVRSPCKPSGSVRVSVRLESSSPFNSLRPLSVANMPRCYEPELLLRTTVFGRSRFKGSDLGLDRGSSLAAVLHIEIQRVPRGRISCANPKTPGGVHVTGPPSRVPLWLAPIILVTVRVPRSRRSLFGLRLRLVAIGHRAGQ